MSFLGAPLTDVLIQPQRKIGSIQVQVVISENTTDTLTVTKQPVQQGASITDHAYLEPVVFAATIYFQNSLSQSLSEIYQSILDLQSSRIPFDIITPKRFYSSMLMTTVSQATDKRTENILSVSISCQQIIIVPVSITQVARHSQKNPATTGATQNAGKKSALRVGADAAKTFFNRGG